MKKLDDYLETAIKNIEEDREITKELLTDIMTYLSISNERHSEVGPIAAKYVETLQRSNEQLVKVSNILLKRQDEDVGLTEEDRTEIFDMLQDKA
jgi:hypothetical protein